MDITSSQSKISVAIVTGGARGIGAAIAIKLASLGHAIGIVDLIDAAETVSTIKKTGGVAHSFIANISDSTDVDKTVYEISEKLGSPTVLVNNAGVTRDNLLFKMTEDDWDTVMEVHLRGTFLMTRAVQTHQVKAGWGRIVNIASQSALGNRGQANYATAKAGLIGLTKTLAIELGKFGITSNAVSPGVVATEMTAAAAKRLGLGFEEYKATMAAGIPVGRVGLPADIANAVAFLASEDSGFISGQNLFVAGGPVN